MFRSALIFLSAALIGLSIQAAVVHSLYPAAIAPDFVVILVVILGLRAQHIYGALGAFCLGLLADFASGQFLGPSAGGAVFAFLIVVFATRKMFADRMMGIAMLTFFACIFKSLTHVVMLGIYAHVNLWGQGVLGTIFVEAALSAVLSPIVCKLISPREDRGITTTRFKEKFS